MVMNTTAILEICATDLKLGATIPDLIVQVILHRSLQRDQEEEDRWNRIMGE